MLKISPACCFPAPTLAATLLLNPVSTALALETSGEIPAFARKYKVSCALCHAPAPRLTEFGETFAGNGFRMSTAEIAPDTLATGDPALMLLENIPLAIRLDSYIQAYNNGNVSSDIELPYNLKLLSGGTLSDDVSYYFYFFLFERGEVGGVEDAFVYFNDIFDAPVDVAVGQFQVSDPLFKRELRLEFQDYAIYRARVGLGPTDLTYDRGVMAVADVGGLTITGEVVNGNGRGEAGSNRRFDDDTNKNFLGHVTGNLFSALRLGVMGYRGRQRGEGATGVFLSNDIWMLGADATLSLGEFELNAQYIHREDDRPMFGLTDPTVQTDGGFVELLYANASRPWYAYGLYNRVDADQPMLDVRLGGPGNITRYEAVSFGVGRMWRRNVRAFFEGTWDTQLDAGRWTLGLVTAF